MNDDLISRAALLETIKEQQDSFEVVSDICAGMAAGLFSAIETIKNAPAVDAEKVCEQMGLVKEAFEMAKADLVAVVRCKDCKHWKCRRMGLTGEVGDCCNDDFPFICESRPVIKAEAFCSYGERRADDGN